MVTVAEQQEFDAWLEQQVADRMRREVQGLCFACGGPIRAWLLAEMRLPNGMWQICMDCYDTPAQDASP